MPGSDGSTISVNITPGSGTDFLAMILFALGNLKGQVAVKIPRGTLVLDFPIAFDLEITPAQHAKLESLVPTPGALLNYFKQLLIASIPPSILPAERAYIDYLFTVARQLLIKVIIAMLKPPPANPCPTGYRWDPTVKACVKELPVTCPPGSHFDPALNRCVPDKPPPPPPPPPPTDGTDLERNKILARLANCICIIEQTLGAAAADDCLCRIADAAEAIANGATVDLAPLTAQVKRIADAADSAPRTLLEKLKEAFALAEKGAPLTEIWQVLSS